MFNEQLLHAQIPKFLGSARATAACKSLGKTTPAVNIINIYGRIFRAKFWRQS
jgi:hypothetical protein